MEKKVSIIIPNYNGEEILRKNLPSLTKAFPKTEIIVVDDASVDNSVAILEKEFQEIALLKLKKNKGFAEAVNAGVKRAKGKYIILLNSDVSVKKSFLNKILPYFDDPKTFAVGLLDKSHERGKVVERGRGGARFSRGLVNHFWLKPSKGKTLWVSGGSGIFDREKFLGLSGFDPIYSPFYWEDIDLSYRAWKKGLICYFEPEAQVDHFHEEGAIKKTRTNFYIKTVSFKNQFLFTWKNIDDDVFIILHILWLPYYFLVFLLKGEFSFFAGLIWAILCLPGLVFSHKTVEDNSLSDREVLSGIEK